MPFVNSGHIWLLAILLVIVLIIWGPGKLPDVGSGLGRAIREFRKASNDTRDEFHKATRGDTSRDPAPGPAHPEEDAASRGADPMPTMDPTAPEVPTRAAPNAPPMPAPAGGGSVLGPPPDEAG